MDLLRGRHVNHTLFETTLANSSEFLYGRNQLRSALEYYRLDMLKEAAAKIEHEHPGTCPTSKSSKAAVIDYIVTYSGE